MTETIQMAHDGETNSGKHQYASPDNPMGQDVCTSYFLQSVFGEAVPDYLALSLFVEGEDASVLHRENVSGGGDGNYGVYGTEGGAITGLYISRDTLGVAEDASPEEFPDEIPFALDVSDEESYEAESVSEEQTIEEAESLLS